MQARHGAPASESASLGMTVGEGAHEHYSSERSELPTQLDCQLQAITAPLSFDEHSGQLLDAWAGWRHALAAESIASNHESRKLDDLAGLCRHSWKQQAS